MKRQIATRGAVGYRKADERQPASSGEDPQSVQTDEARRDMLLGPDALNYEIARYQAYRAQVEHEDHLLAVRLGWLIALEAFLFAGYSNLVRDKTPPPLFDVLPWLGVVIALLVLLAITAAIVALKRLREAYPEVLSGFPLVISATGTHHLGLAPVYALPVALIVAWIYVGI